MFGCFIAFASTPRVALSYASGADGAAGESMQAMRGDLNSNVCKRYRAAKMADMAAIETAKKAVATKGEA